MKTGLLQLIEHAHSGRLRAHAHTSYAGLTFALLLTGVMLAAASLTAIAATPAVNPQTGSIGLTGTVHGPAPKTAATITSPRPGQHTSTIPLTVSGTCPAGTFVQITKNNVFAGATSCLDDNTFTLQIDLFDGANTLVARVSDALGQFGPDSNAVEVFYDAPSLEQPGGAIGRQLFLQTNTTVVAGSPGVPVTRLVSVVGGTGPYAVSFDWGDGTSSLVSLATEGPVSATHTYGRPGSYRVIVRATDAAGNSAFLQLVTIINGTPETIGATNGTGPGSLPGSLLAAWPLYVVAGIMVGLFWLGEIRQLHKIRVLQQLANRGRATL